MTQQLNISRTVLLLWFPKNNKQKEKRFYNEKLIALYCNKLNDRDSAVNSIIQEEYTAYINGETMAQKCAELIQNRVSIYLSEQS